MHYLYLNELSGKLLISSNKLDESHYLLLADSSNFKTLKHMALSWLHGFNVARDSPNFELNSTYNDFENL